MIPARRFQQNWVPSIFDDFFDNDWMRKTNATAPAINVLESEDEYKVEVAAAGMNKNDFNIHIDQDGNLVIEMEKKVESSDEQKEEPHYLRREFSYSKFQQTLILPDDVNKEAIQANVADGVLTIDLPRLKPEEQKKALRQIEVK